MTISSFPPVKVVRAYRVQLRQKSHINRVNNQGQSRLTQADKVTISNEGYELFSQDLKTQMGRLTMNLSKLGIYQKEK